MPDYTSLLQTLKNPDSPAFAQALEIVSNLNPREIPAAEIPSLLANLQDTLHTLESQKNQTEAELQKLRNQTNALKSYARP